MNGRDCHIALHRELQPACEEKNGACPENHQGLCGAAHQELDCTSNRTKLCGSARNESAKLPADFMHEDNGEEGQPDALILHQGGA